jgi:esterase
MQRNGRVNSGDVSIFYRAFGAPGRTPILLMHGANYFDSYDWIGVGEALATDREVASYDKRGFGESGWSPSKDYSGDANLGDILAVIAGLKWDRPIVVGHSASGRLSIAFAASFPDKISRLIVVDSGMARDEGGGGRPTLGNPPLVFESVDAAMAHFAKLSNPPRISHDRERAQAALVKVESGYMLKRDPDSGNTKPQGEAARLPRREPRDVWQDLAAVKCPAMIVHALRSDRLDAKMLGRLDTEHKNIAVANVDCRHDIPNEQPEALLAHVRKFLG